MPPSFQLSITKDLPARATPVLEFSIYRPSFRENKSKTGSINSGTVLEFLKSLWGLGTEEE
jgi:hypothetical protein